MHSLTGMSRMGVGYSGEIELGIRSEYDGEEEVQLWRIKVGIRLE